MLRLAFTPSTPLHSSSQLRFAAISLRRQSTFISARPQQRLSNQVTNKGYRVSTPTANMYGWIRKMVGAPNGDPTTATLNELGVYWQHEVLDGRPLLPPDGKWAPPLQQATFGLGWYVFLVDFTCNKTASTVLPNFPILVSPFR